MDNKKFFHIIQASLKDIDIVSLIFDEYRQFYAQTSNINQAKIFLTERLQKHESMIFLALDRQTQTSTNSPPTGLGFLQLYPSFSSISMQRQWILNDLFVRHEARGKGVAQALIYRAIEYAKETQSKGLVLETAVDNDPAQKLYARIGFKKETEFLTYYYYFVPDPK